MTSFQRPSFWSYRSKPSAKSKPKVNYGSPSEGVLQHGDVITKVGNYDSRDIRHQDAQTLFNNAGCEIRLVVQRDNPAATQKRQQLGSAGSSHHTYSPALSPLSPAPLSPRVAAPSLSNAGPLSPAAFNASVPALTPYYGLPFTPLDNYHFTVQEATSGGYRRGGQRGGGGYGADGGDMHLENQPYRTTPLVLPGAKVTRDGGHTESYLRHHPNPIVRAPPHQIIDHDRFMKEKAANAVLQRIQNEDPSKQFVHKQFNSPIGLYSDSNIADTVYKQTGTHQAPKPALKYNPEDSETYRAIREEQYGETQQIVSGPQSKVFVPNKVPAARKPGPVYSLPARNVNSMGDTEETIHQSGSFKRLMYHVMAETDY